MGRPRKWENEAARRAGQDAARRGLRAEHRVAFTGVDGEGTGTWRQHKYVLLGVGDRQIEDPKGLVFPDIMRFLWDCFTEHPGNVFGGFFLGYDFTQWFKSLPEERARMLLTDWGKAKRARTSKHASRHGPFPVRYLGWEFDILGMRRFKLRPEGGSSWMFINDAGPYFQTSFLNVINPANWDVPVVTQEEYEEIKRGKENRETAVLGPDMRYYNMLENEVFARVLTRLNEGFVRAGIRLKRDQWYGPGQAAQIWLGRTKTPETRVVHEVVPKAVIEAARGAYYGGWFEIMAHGHIPGPTWEYDINSAYPHIASGLPCLLHGKWDHNTEHFRTVQWLHGSRTPYSLVHARVHGSNKRIGAMLHRCPDGSIRRPWNTAGWFWASELQAAAKAGLVDTVQVMDAWTYIPCGCEPPLAEIPNLYDERLKVGKNTPYGKAIRLLLNSKYGKFAQSIGNPKYNNYLYAGKITSGCREMICDAIATHERGAEDVVMVATDGVYFRSCHRGLRLSNRLGDWEESEKANLCLFKPGVYWDDSTRNRIREGTNPGLKARGISARDFASSIGTIDTHFSTWRTGEEGYPRERDPSGNRELWYPKVRFRTSFSMVTCQQALQRGKWYLAGAVDQRDVIQDSDPVTKRHSGEYADGVYWSQPYEGWWEEESTPYSKGMDLEEDDYGITDDGSVSDHIAWILKG